MPALRPPHTPTYLFVYGTLRQALRHPMHGILLRHGEAAGLARYAGRLFDLGPYPAVVPDPGGAPSVVGELYSLPDPEAVLALLDRYEGCTDERGEAVSAPRSEYRREAQRVIRRNGAAVTAWLYLYTRLTLGHRHIAGGDYVAYRRFKQANGG